MVIYFFSKDSDREEWRKEKQKGEENYERKQEEHARKGEMRNSSGEELSWKSAKKDGGS